MKIDDCKTLPEVFGVKRGNSIWIDGTEYNVMSYYLRGDRTSFKQDAQALFGCLTGQLKWSTEPPKPEPNDDEVAILREAAKWLEEWYTLDIDSEGDLKCESDMSLRYRRPYGTRNSNRRQIYPYRVLVPIIEKCGVIDLRKYREEKEQ
ncbi:MAG: hypothetical protein M0P13_09450 [Fibrobacteraceae bacterium]|nr:hypothetical protein [Fibrobacteraceae bacterium]